MKNIGSNPFSGCSAKKTGRKKVWPLFALVMATSALAGCAGVYTDGSDPFDHDFGDDCEGISTSMDVDGTIHLCWMERVKEYGEFINRLYYSRMDSSGRVIIPPADLVSGSVYNDTVEDRQCSIDVNSKGEPYIVYGLRGEIFLISITENGYPGKVTLISSGSITAMDPDIWIDADDNMHVVWSDFRGHESRILYSRLSPHGTILKQPRVIGPTGGYDPSIAIGDDGFIYIAYYREYSLNGYFLWWEFGDDEVYRSLRMHKFDMALDYEVDLYLNIEIEHWEGISSMDMMIDSNGYPVVYWESYDVLNYYQVKGDWARKDPPKEREFDTTMGYSVSMMMNDHHELYNYTIEVTVEETHDDGHHGDVMMVFNDQEPIKLGSYSIPADHGFFNSFFGPDQARITRNVTHIIDRDGNIEIYLVERSDNAPPIIEEARLIYYPNTTGGELTFPVTLSNPAVSRPSGSPDNNGGMVFVWFSSGAEETISLKRIDQFGYEFQFGKQFRRTENSIIDVSICMDDRNHIYVFWVEETEEENQLWFSSADNEGSIVMQPERLSANPRRWHWYDDIGGPVPATLILGIPLISLFTLALYGGRRYYKNRTNGMIAIELDQSEPVDNMEEYIEFEVIKKG